MKGFAVHVRQTILSPTLPAITAAQVAQAQAWVAASAAHWCDSAHFADDIAAIEALAQHFRHRCKTVVVCGTGGSSLSAWALYDLVAHPLRETITGTPQLHVLDSTDPELLEAALALPPESTGWIFISRSGHTLETLAQFLAFISRGLHTRAAMVQIITLEDGNPLQQLAQHAAVPVMAHPPAIGGRYACLSNVGMLPAAILGFDIRQLRAGARAMLSDDGVAMALAAAHWHRACAAQGYHTHTMLPYHARFYGWTYWYRQLWAESLGKNGQGSTPLIGLAPLDQHSMLQLLLDGPHDKSITTLQVTQLPHMAPNPPLPDAFLPHGSVQALVHGLEGGKIIHAQAYGTTQSFLRRHLPVRELHVPDLSAASIGALFMQQMMETILTAQLMGVNPFDQPAVEESKTIALEQLATR